jgi:hypothetical protein
LQSQTRSVYLLYVTKHHRKKAVVINNHSAKALGPGKSREPMKTPMKNATAELNFDGSSRLAVPNIEVP